MDWIKKNRGYVILVTLVVVVLALLTVSITLKTGSTSYSEQLPTLTEKEKRELIAVSRTAVRDFYSGKRSKALASVKRYKNALHVTLFQDGRWLCSAEAKEGALPKSIYKATVGCLRSKNIKKAKADLAQIHIQIAGNERRLSNKFQRGVHGLRFKEKSNIETLQSSYAIEKNKKKKFLYKKLCQKLGAKKDCHKNKQIKKSMFDSLHFAESRFGSGVVTYFRGNIYNDELNSSYERIETSFANAEKWLVDNLMQDGKFIYLYQPSRRKYSSKNNMIRQIMGSRVLAELAATHDEYKDAHRKNIEFILKNWYVEKGSHGYIYFKNKSKLGALAMFLRTIVYSPFYNEYKGVAQKLAKAMISLQNSDGSLEPWYVKPNYKYDKERLLNFYSGEALLALFEYAKKSGDKSVLAAAIKSQDFYLNRYVNEIDSWYYPPYVPWHSQSMSLAYKITGKEKYMKGVFVMNDRLLEMQNRSGKPSKDHFGRFFNPKLRRFGSPHSSSDAVYTEGMAYAFELAHIAGDQKRIEKYQESLRIGVHNLMNLQYKGDDIYYMKYPARVLGSLRINVTDNRLRIDTTQHMMDGYFKILRLMKEYGLEKL